MNLFGQRKNKRFNYVSRHERTAENDMKAQWSSVRGRGKHVGKSKNKLVVLLIILGMIIALWMLLSHYELT